MLPYLWVFIGGGLGSVLRFGVASYVNLRFKPIFPLATLISNISSCIILACLVFYFAQKEIANQDLKLLLLVGFCGGFSTFSTFSFETVELLKNNHLYYAIGNILISIVACMSIFFILLKNNPQ